VPRAIGLAKLLTKLFPAEIGAMDGEVLRRLSQQPSQPLQAIAAHLAAHHPNGMNFVDVGALVASENPSLVAAAISILGKRPIDALAADVAAIAAFLTAPAPEPRAAALPLAARLQNERPEAAIELAEMLLPTRLGRCVRALLLLVTTRAGRCCGRGPSRRGVSAQAYWMD